MADNMNNQVEQVENLSEILQVRRDKLATLQENGKNPFEITKFDVNDTAKNIKDTFDETVEKYTYCNNSGLRASKDCASKGTGWYAADTELAFCSGKHPASENTESSSSDTASSESSSQENVSSTVSSDASSGSSETPSSSEDTTTTPETPSEPSDESSNESGGSESGGSNDSSGGGEPPTTPPSAPTQPDIDDDIEPV